MNKPFACFYWLHSWFLLMHFPICWVLLKVGLYCISQAPLWIDTTGKGGRGQEEGREASMLPRFSLSQGNISRVAVSSRDPTQPLCATHSQLTAYFTLAVFQCLCPSGPIVSSASPELLLPQRCHTVPGMRRPRLADFLLLLTFAFSSSNTLVTCFLYY